MTTRSSSAAALIAVFAFSACADEAPSNVDAGRADDAASSPDVRTCAPCDDDCDTVIDYDFESDVAHCGGCRAACAPPPPGAAVACVMAQCEYACTGALLSCNGELTSSDPDGCEVDPDTDPAHCGGCAVGCPAAPPGYGATAFACAGGECESRVVAITAGNNMTCVRLAGGLSYCWGSNVSGQLGDGTGVDFVAPVVVGGTDPSTGITSLGAGGGHVCAVSEGQLLCWGYANRHELGTVSVRSSDVPVAADPEQPAATGVFSEVASGTSVSIARTDTGEVYVWGVRFLPVGSTQDQVPTRLFGVDDAVGVYAGAGHRCILVTGGQLLCLGKNDLGQLGNGTYASVRDPAPVVGISDVIDVGLGQDHSCAVSSDGSVRCWGRNDRRQCGRITFPTSITAPMLVEGLPPAVAIDGGTGHTCALLADGTIRCWGWADRGQLGVGSDVINMSFPTPMMPLALPGELSLPVASAIVVGGDHSCMLAVDDRVICWGWNQQRQVGVPGTGSRVYRPRVVEGLPGF